MGFTPMLWGSKQLSLSDPTRYMPLHPFTPEDGKRPPSKNTGSLTEYEITGKAQELDNPAQQKSFYA